MCFLSIICWSNLLCTLYWQLTSDITCSFKFLTINYMVMVSQEIVNHFDCKSSKESESLSCFFSGDFIVTFWKYIFICYEFLMMLKKNDSKTVLQRFKTSHEHESFICFWSILKWIYTRFDFNIYWWFSRTIMCKARAGLFLSVQQSIINHFKIAIKDILSYAYV